MGSKQGQPEGKMNKVKRIAVITGAAQGIGHRTARVLAERFACAIASTFQSGASTALTMRNMVGTIKKLRFTPPVPEWRNWQTR